jgi:beta-mannosidase
MSIISLNGEWELRDEPLARGAGEARAIAALVDGWIAAPVPGDIHQALLAAGRIAEPLVGMHSYECAWTEARAWWYRLRFDAPTDWHTADRVELELDGLDSNAAIFLNDVQLGTHINAFRPFVRDVKPHLRPEENCLLVRLTTGVETVTEEQAYSMNGVPAPTEAGNGRPDRGDIRRPFVRKPQFTFGWDWSPRLATTAIAGGVRLHCIHKACIRDVQMVAAQRPDEAVDLTSIVSVDWLDQFGTTDATVTLTVTDENGEQHAVERAVMFRSGLNYINLTVTLDRPRLWWPNGLGGQHRYTIDARVTIDDQDYDYPGFKYGLRFVELCTDGTFAVVVNGEKVFCKGANWVPCDAVYARASDERYTALLEEARTANFTMLRIWGGGWYEREVFYDTCDRLGLMVWQDFMFACAPYPDHLDWFNREVEHEAAYQTRRLRNHASVVLWCGNNENHAALYHWWARQTEAGTHIYNYLLPAIVRRNCPGTPYWNSSPYGGPDPGCQTVGDDHHWHECMMNPEMEHRTTPERYDECTSPFLSEFGYIGACCPASTRQYLDGPLDSTTDAWRHHTNTFEKSTVAAGIAKHYGGPESLSVEEYLYYSELCQGLMYQHAFDSTRYRANNFGCLFWMYNDAWGEIGWTVIDYYLRRKPSFYYTQRAYAPVRLVLREHADGIRCVAANDTREEVQLDVEHGYVALDGTERDDSQTTVSLPPLSRTECCVMERRGHDARAGIWFAHVPERDDIAPAVFRAVDFRELRIVDPRLQWEVLNATNTSCTVRISAEAYAHAVHVVDSDDIKCSDNYFDLLPRDSRTIRIELPDGRRAEDICFAAVTPQIM